MTRVLGSESSLRLVAFSTRGWVLVAKATGATARDCFVNVVYSWRSLLFAYEGAEKRPESDM